ncbi:phosphoribosylanthranilate isomerase [Alteraurantiacibacter aquimixticola]|uniref:N-(5'-phosphoribosyl)anthranilate isomerase n=1 Tax=Alteraurantiacibacter aquimixticola TaxID=2489173 RepID=A0A4T3F081_9SPHN|nr:phosphoribosylanthranilate isomerase [Alteraurantiacibacter aquimixticola]TIX50324.1 phosphoribosylanthranilate isomerase [Alteraurantiacibacter aquimixticola]
MSGIAIKICGLKTPEQVRAAADAGASHVGLVHFARSPRHLSLEDAARLRQAVPDAVKPVLLVVDMPQDELRRACEAVRPDVVQLHGKETPETCAALRDVLGCEVWKACGVKDRAMLDDAQRYVGAVDMLLYDAPAGKLPGGQGLAIDWSLFSGFKHKAPWGLAGGLTAQNVGEAIRQTGAPLVDTSSGVESAPGLKDIEKIRAFCRAARDA